MPAFAIDRTQELLYLLRELIEDEAIPPLPIFLDSPMGREATAAYRACAQEHDAEMRELVRSGVDPLAPSTLEIIGQVDESKRLNAVSGPVIIISASGMATGGRVLHHLRHRLPDPSTTVVFVGFQAEGTRGRRILDGEPEVKIFGQMVPVATPSIVFVTHGEPAASQALADRLATRFGWRCVIPSLEETVTL